MNIFTRSKLNPILKPNKNNAWESRKVYNSGVIFENNQYSLFYRAVGNDWISRIGLATSTDGEKFTTAKKPLLSPTEKFEEKGVEDSRIVKIGDKYFLTYTGFDGATARLKLATSKNLNNWKKVGVLFPDWNFFTNKNFIVTWDKAFNDAHEDINWSKAGGIFPELINGKYRMLFGDRNIWHATSDDGLKWSANNKPFLEPRKGSFFDSTHIEMGPPPIKTKKGWLVLYHGINKKIEYKIGFVLLDLKDPTKIIYRSRKPIFEPSEPYEINGLVDILPGGFDAPKKMNTKQIDVFVTKNKQLKKMPKVVFCCGAVLRNNKLRIFYGASDSVICTATAKLEDILKTVK